jgi:hypothetical protein
VNLSEIIEVLLPDKRWHLIIEGTFAETPWRTGTAGFTATEVLAPGYAEIHGPMSSVQAVRLARRDSR